MNKLDSAKAMYEQAVSMYLHEDGIGVQKVNNFLYLNVGIVAGLGIIDSDRDSARLCFAGSCVAFLFFLSLLNGRVYLLNRKEAVKRLAEELNPESSSDQFFSDPPKFRFRKKGTVGSTSALMCGAAILVSLIWFFLACKLWDQSNQSLCADLRHASVVCEKEEPQN